MRRRVLEAENARLVEAERRNRRTAEILQAAALALTQAADLDTVLERMLDYLVQLVPYDSACVMLPAESRLTIRAMRGYECWTDPAQIRTLSFDVHETPNLREILATRDVFLIPDTATYVGWERAPANEYIRSWMGVPLVSGDLVVGVYSVDKSEPGFFTPEHAVLAKALAAHAAVAIVNARLLQDVRASNTQLQVLIAERERAQQAEHEQRVLAEALREISALLDSSLDLEEVLDRILTHVGRVVPYEAGTILMIEGDVAVVTHAKGYEQSILGLKLRLKETPNLLRILETGRPSVIEDTRTSDIWIPSPETSWIRSSMGVAIRADEQVIGFLNLDRDTPYVFTPEHVERLQSFAHQAGVAVRNARLYASVERARQTTETLRTAQLAFTKSLDLDAICEAFLDHLGELVPYDSATIFLLESDSRLTARAVRGYERWVDPDLARAVSFDLQPGSVMHTLVTTRKSITIPDTAQHPSWVFVPSGAHIRSWLGVPMVVGDKVVGAYSLDATRPWAFTQEHIQLAEALAVQAAFASQNARHFEDAQRRAAELEALRRSSLQLTSSLALPAVLHSIAESALGLVGADNCHIYLYDETKQAIAFSTALWKDGRSETVWDVPRAGGLTATVAREGRPMVINDAMRHPLYASSEAQGWGIQAIAGLPLKRAEQVLGVLNLVFLEPHTFSEEELRVLGLLADQAAVAIENARLFDETNRLLAETRQRTVELEVINRVQQGLAAPLDIQAKYDLVGDEIRNLFDVQAVLINSYDRATGLQHLRYHFERGRRFYEEPTPISGLGQHLIRTQQALLLNEDVERSWNEFSLYLPPDTEMPRSMLCVPLIAGDQVRGSIGLQNLDREFAFSEPDVRLLTTLANSMSIALENAHLFAETRQQAAELTTVNRISQALASQLDMDALVYLVGEQLRHTFSADIAYVALLDRQSQMIHFPYVFGEELTSLRLGEGLASHILLTGRPLLLNGDSDVRRTGLGVQRVGVPSLSYLGVPIPLSDEAIGVLSVQSTHEEGRFDDSDLRLLSTIAANVGTALQNARLYQEIRQRAGQMAALAEVGREVSASLELSTVLSSIAGQVHTLFRARDTILHLLEPDGRTFRTTAALGRYAAQFESDVLTVGQGILGSIAQSGVAEVIDNVAQDPRGVHVAGTPEVEESPETLMCAPLTSRGQTVGLLTVYRDRDQGLFTSMDLDFLVALVRQAAAAIENARLFAEVASQKQYSESLLQNSPVAIVTVAGDGTVLSWNPAAKKLFGYEPAEALGHNLDAIISTPELREEAIGFTRQAASGIRIHGVTRRCRRDGTLVDVEVLAVMVDEEDPSSDIIAIYHDITELQRARQEAEAATQAKSAFLATMSHEIRTPMNAVIGMTSLLLDTELTAEQREFAETIRTSGDALLAVINDVLDFSKIEAGRIELERQPFDLRECVEGAVALLAPGAAEKGLELVCHIDAGVPPAIVGDEARLRQILLNLLSNAVKFTELGEVVVTVQRARDGERQPTDSPGTLLHFSVRDTGIGIPSGRVDRLFKSFSQVDSSTTRKHGGTGLGLAISARLCALMGGRMWVESPAPIPTLAEEGARGGPGSVFHFTILAEEAQALPPAFLRGEQADLRGRRVLIVDDNAASRRILTLQTEGWGMAARATGSPLEALEWLRHGEPFDVAVVDRQMPDMDGLMVAAEIREVRDATALPLVLVSSLAGREAGAEGELFAAFLLKPIRASQLYDALVGVFAAQGPLQREEEPARSEFDAGMGVRWPLRILLAEDHVTNQKLVLLMLGRLGYRADVAANGREVLAALARQPYDVVLMDVQMPEMDGLEAARQIRNRWPAELRPRIVAMTANVMKEDREACFAAGMDDYLGKPIRVEALIGALSRCHPPTEPPQPARTSPTPVESPESAPETTSPRTELDRSALETLLALVGGEPSLLAELIDSFLQETPSLLVELCRSVEKGDAAGLRKAAHTLKASSQDFGATRLSDSARELEAMGKASTLAGAADLVAQVEAEYSRVKAALEGVRMGKYPWRSAT